MTVAAARIRTDGKDSVEANNPTGSGKSKTNSGLKQSRLICGVITLYNTT
jgi:hypothetical protein